MRVAGRAFRVVAAAAATLWSASLAVADPSAWRAEWPRTDFSRTTVDLGEILSGGPPKDGIPAIDDPRFAPADAVEELGPHEPVIGLVVNGDARAYPLRIMIWHEIVNDTVGGVPVAVTYCPLCNSAVVFDRRVGGRTLSFGTTGKLRRSDLVMYDRETESWWQQFLGLGIVGTYAGTRLSALPARLESIRKFRERAPRGKVLVPTDAALRRYGKNPYARYDQAKWPFLYDGAYDAPIPPLARVVVIGKDAWPLDVLRRRGRIEWGDYVLSWEEGQNSALDAEDIALGWDVGNVTVQKRTPSGLEDAVYDVALAFAFRAFHPDGTLHAD